MRSRLLALLFFASCFGPVAYGKNIGYDHIFTSPDGLFSLHLAEADDVEIFSIKNNKTGVIDSSQTVELPPVFAIKWAGDSQSFAVIGHIAGGSQAMAYHIDHGNWKWINVFPENSPAYDVIGLRSDHAFFVVSYKAIEHVTKSNGAPAAVYYKLDMKVDPSTGKITTSNKERINEHTYMNTPGAEELDWK